MNLKRPSLKGTGLGSRLKASELKPPDFLADLYYDLRDRRLLPVIALVVVAIAAVPFLLGEGGESPHIAAPDPEVADAGGGVGDGAQLTVVESTPGLRDYRKRLRGTPTNPFVQRYTGVPSTSQLESTGTGGGSDAAASSGDEPTVSPESGGAPPASTGGGGSTPASPDTEDGDDPDKSFYAYRPNVRFGIAGTDDLPLYEHLSLGKLLPKDHPVLVFIGASEDGERVAFDLSREVTGVRGPGKCVGGKDDCGLLILRAGQAVDLSTDTSGRTFRLHVIRIEFVEVERPKPAESSAQSADEGLAAFQNFSK